MKIFRLSYGMHLICQEKDLFGEISSFLIVLSGFIEIYASLRSF